MNELSIPHSRTKIVATIGPASRSPAALGKLMEAGVNIFRLNFSHGTHAEHSAAVAAIRACSAELNKEVAILQDLCGPKMRLGTLAGELVECSLGEEFSMVVEPGNPADPRELTCSYRELPNDLKVGESVLFADGTVGMEVVETGRGRAKLRVVLPGRLRSRQGINLPGSELAVKSLTDKDLADLDWTANHPGAIQYVGYSFVRSAEDVEWLRRELRARNCGARIVVKIEKPQAVRNLEAIVAATDAVMVARGDLGVEMEVQRVPAIQKRIIDLCNRTHRPVITATQMLNSMEHSSRPTRAEASDVFNAVVDGTDAVMLSGETAIGEYPTETVLTMRQICVEAEAFLKGRPRRGHWDTAPLKGFVEPVTEAAVDAACLLTERLDAPVIVVATESGRTALALSNRRPAAAILALTRSEQVARELSLGWGIKPVVVPDHLAAEEELAYAIDLAKSRRILAAGQFIVLLRGQVSGQAKDRAVIARKVDEPNEEHAR
jgi:pyruvate kinase